MADPAKHSTRRPAPGALARMTVLMAVVLACASALACRASRGLGEGIPRIDGNTPVLPAFDPASLTDPAQTGLSAADTKSGPPKAPTPPEPPPLPAPELLVYGPQGRTNSTTEIQLRFNRPMVPLGEHEPMTPAEAGLTFDPPMEGLAHWAEPTRLEFVPHEGIPPAHQFSVHYEATLRAIDGPERAFVRDWSFFTPGPDGNLSLSEDSLTSEGDAHWKARVVASFSQPVTLSTLRKHLRAEALDPASGALQPIAVKVRKHPVDPDGWNEGDFEIRPASRWPADREIVLRIDGALVGTLGPAPMGYEEVFSFESDGHVRAMGLECDNAEYSDGCDLGPVSLQLSSPIRRSQGRQGVRVSPPVKNLGSIASDRHYDWRRDRPKGLDAYGAIQVWGEFERGKIYTLTLDRLTDVHGQTLEAAQEFEVVFVEPPPELSLHNERGTFPAQAPALLGVESRHLESVEFKVQALSPRDAVAAFLDHQQNERDTSTLSNALGGASAKTVTLQHVGAFAWSSTAFDLHAETGGRRGLIAFEVAPGPLLPRAQGRHRPNARRSFVQLTDIGVNVASSLEGGVVRVTSLASGRPLADAEVEIVGRGDSLVALGQTDADGLVEIPLDTPLSSSRALRVRHGDDSVLVGAQNLHSGSPMQPDGGLRQGESVRATLMTERSLYKPGEVVRAVGWAAIATPYELASLRPLPSDTRVEFQLLDRNDEVVDTAAVFAKDHGKFWATLEVPDTGALGHYEVRSAVLGQRVAVNVQVKDFTSPPFEVHAEAAKGDLHHGETTTASVRADYYFGAPVPMTRLRQVTECSVRDFRPPGFDPSWQVGPRREWSRHYGTLGGPNQTEGARPDPSGRVQYTLRPRATTTELPASCTHSVAVTDASESEVGAETSLWLHPPFYLGAELPERYKEAGETLDVDLRTVDFDGSGLPVSEVRVELTREWSEPEFETVDGVREFIDYRARTQTLPACVTQTDDAGEARCTFPKLEAGSYTIHAVAQGQGQGDYAPVVDGWLWVYESDQRWNLPSTPAKELTLDLSATQAKVGDRVSVQVRAPWAQGNAVLLMAKGAIHEVHPVEFDQGRASVTFEVSEAWAPKVEFHALAVSPGDAKTRTLPKLHTTAASVEVGNQSRRLQVSLQVPDVAQTRQTLPIEVRARDYRGRPALGHVSVWAVDEAVLSLSPPVIPSFVEAFTAGFAADIRQQSSYWELQLPYQTRPDDYVRWIFDPRWREQRGVSGGITGGMGYGSGAGFGGRGTMKSGGGRGGPPMPVVRNQFSSAPIFIGDAELDADGVAHLEGTLPDNLTTFRLTAVVSSPLPGAQGDAAEPSRLEPRFGVADARTRVTQPLVLRSALPRVLRPGDTAELGVLVDNLGGGAGQLEVAVHLVDGEGVLELLSSPKASVAVAAGGQVRLPFQVRALATGAPQFEVEARLDPSAAGNRPVADALRLPIPVEAERTLSDRVAVYGDLGPGLAGAVGRGRTPSLAAVLPFTLPTQIDPNFGGLSVSLGSTILGGVEDAAAYLVHYPYGCVEQTSSSLLPLVPLGRLAEQGYPLGIGDTDHYIRAGVQRLRSMQLPDGSFSYWPGGTEAAPYASAYATWVLGRAQMAGYPVPEHMLALADGYMQARLERWASETGPTEGEDIEAAQIAWTLSERGAAPAAALNALYERRGRLPTFAKATLTLAMARALPADPRLDSLLIELAATIDEREAVAKVETDSRWTWYWDTDIRSSALALLAYLSVAPDHPLVPKLTRGLLESRRGGRWSNTQENALALIALATYARIYEAEEPDFEGRVWLANQPVVAIEIQGRGFAFEDGFAPMAELLAALGGQPVGPGAASPVDQLILERAGAGRMYYRVGLEWASTATDLPAKAEGVAIRRILRDATGVLGEDPSIESGTLLALDLELELHSQLDYLAAELPLPAGLEAIDMELGKGKAAMRISGRRAGWVSHQELRRDRAVIFADHLPPGTHQTTVFLRATTPGDYVMPAASAELMYYPEIYGRTVGGRVSVR